MSAVGTHLLLDFYEATNLTDVNLIEKTLRQAAKDIGATVLDVKLHHFQPQNGVTGVALLAESHVSIHTWPEKNYAALDVFVCGNLDPRRSIKILKDVFNPKTEQQQLISRGDGGLWFREDYHKTWEQTFKVKRQILDAHTKYQHVNIFENDTFGKVFVLDDIVQCTEKDEFVNHEMLAHVPICSRGDVKNVLIIGGGDGGVLEEVLKHESVESVTMVDIDGEVIDIAKTHLRSICKDAFDDPRTKLIIGDAIEWVKTSTDKFDVIVVDRPDPIGPGVGLFDKEFYQNCSRLMTHAGIIVFQSGVLTFAKDWLRKELELQKQVWSNAGFYISTIPTYAGGLSVHGWAANWNIAEVTPGALQRRIMASGITGLKYYDLNMHKAAFTLPPFAAEI